MRTLFPFAAAAAVLLSACSSRQEESLRFITPLPFSRVQIQDGFWSPRLQAHKDVTLPLCIDQIENQTGRIRNFESWKPSAMNG